MSPFGNKTNYYELPLTILFSKKQRNPLHAVFSPGQDWLLQICFSRDSPWQLLPPDLGVWFVQLLERSWDPVPQDLVQEVQLLQLDHPPFTTEQERGKGLQCYRGFYQIKICFSVIIKRIIILTIIRVHVNRISRILSRSMRLGE